MVRVAELLFMKKEELAKLVAKLANENKRLLGDMRSIATLAHSGGLINMTEPEVCAVIRRLTLSYFDTAISIRDAKQLLIEIKQQTPK